MLVDNILLDDEVFKIETTTHFENRLEDRNIELKDVIKDVKLLGNKVYKYNNTGKEIALVDDDKHITSIIEVRHDKVVLITVIGKSDEFQIKDGTVVEKVF